MTMSSRVPSVSEHEKLPIGTEVIRAEDICKSYDGREILSGVNLSVRKGETVVVMGRSGSGKTTCLRALMGQEMPDRGRVSLFGKVLAETSRKELDAIRRRFGVVFQPVL